MLADVDAPSVVTAGQGGTERRLCLAAAALRHRPDPVPGPGDDVLGWPWPRARATRSWSGPATGRDGPPYPCSAWPSSTSWPMWRSSPALPSARRSWASRRRWRSSGRWSFMPEGPDRRLLGLRAGRGRAFAGAVQLRDPGGGRSPQPGPPGVGPEPDPERRAATTTSPWLWPLSGPRSCPGCSSTSSPPAWTRS